MSFEIVTDSSANLPASVMAAHHIHCIPLTFRDSQTNIKSCENGQPFDPTPFYRRMAEKGDTFTTSCVNTAEALALLEPIAAAGRDILYLGFSSGLSATFQNVSNALTELKERYSSRTFWGCDTLCASLGQGLMTVLAAQKRDCGESLETVARWVMDNRLRVCHWFTVDSLKYLYRGGRLSAAGALLGTLLDIKPILHMNNEGQLQSVSKARGQKAAVRELLSRMRQSITPDSPVYIVHALCEERAHELADRIRGEFGQRDILIAPLDLVIGAHSGPGTLSVFFMGDAR